MSRLRVYIAGPITTGDLCGNISRAEAAFHRLASAGYAPFCPHWSCYGGGPKVTPAGSVYTIAATTHSGMSHRDWLDIDLCWVAASHAVLRLPGASVGADKETAHAILRGIPVFTSFEQLEQRLNAPYYV